MAATWSRIQLRKATEPFDAQELAVDLKQVGPLVGPVVDVVGVADQAIDQLVALDLGCRACRPGTREPHRPSGGSPVRSSQTRRRNSASVQSSEGRIFIRFHLAATRLVDLAVGGRLGPDEAGAVSHDGHGGGRVVPLEPRQHRRLAATHGRRSARLGRPRRPRMLPLSRNASRVTSRTSPPA